MFEDLFNIRGLSLERLNTLLKLSETGSLIKAANNEHGKQSRLSHHLRELSGYFGVELTERAG
jgi:DNA-binding transcriptional LysR family regulator